MNVLDENIPDSRLLRHPAFNTKAKRMGKVIQVTHMGMRIWQLHAEKEKKLLWPTSGRDS